METYDNDVFGENFYDNYEAHAYVAYDKNLRIGTRISRVDSGLGTFFLTTVQGRKVVNQELVYLDWKNQLSNKWLYKLKSHYKQSETDDDKFRRESTGSSNRHGSINIGSNSLVIDNQFIFSHSDDLTLLGGLFYEKSNQRTANAPFIPNATPQPVLTDQEERNWDNYALYFQSEWKPYSELYTVVGLRIIDSKEQYDSQLLPRLGLNYKVSDDWSASFNYQRGYRPPSVIERYPTASFLQVNTNLQPEIIDTYEFSLFGKINPHNKVRATLFYSDVTELIVRSPTGLIAPQPTVVDENGGDLSVQGLELGYQWIASPRLKLDINYAFTDSEDKTTNQKTEHIVQNKINLSIDYTPKPDWRIVWDNYYRLDPKTHPSDPIYLGEDAKSWLLSNLSISVDKLYSIQGLSGTFTIKNLFDEQYGHSCRCGAGRPGISNINSQETRNILLSLRYNF